MAGSNGTRGRVDAMEKKPPVQQGKMGAEEDFSPGRVTLISTLYGSTNCQRAITSANNADTIALINLL